MSKPIQQRLFDGFEDDDAAAPKPVGDDKPSGPGETRDDLQGKTVYVVDAHALIFQVFHAMPEMSSPTGQPVGAIHGFIRDVLDLLEKQKPDYLFCAFDHSAKTFRHEMYDRYKIDRDEMPPDLRPQIPNIRRMLDAMGVASLSCPNYEADDILATFAGRVEKRGGNCVLVTNDKDCRQLIGDHVKMFNIRKSTYLDADVLQKDWGVRPDQVVDFQALVGDSVDNVPGVPLIGPKAAKELLNQYGTLEAVLDHASEVSGKKRQENLVNFRDQALLSRELVRLVDAPVEIDWNAGRVGGFDERRVLELCDEFGFRRLAERLTGLAVKAAPSEWRADYRTVATEDGLQTLIETMSRQEQIAVNTLATAANARWADIVGYAFAWQEAEAYYIPVRAPRGDPALDPVVVLEAIRPILEDPAIKKIGQNLKRDIVLLRSAGVTLRGVDLDTMVADYLLDPGQRTHNLDGLAKRYLNHTAVKLTDLTGTGKKQKRLDQVPVEFVMRYAAECADVSLRLSRILGDRLQRQQLGALFHRLEMPLIEVLAELEFNGIKIDVGRLGELSGRFGRRMAELEAEIYAMAGQRFNIDSPKQLAYVLFDELKLPVVKKTKTGPSTDADVLAQLALRHPLPAKIVEYRQNAKLKSTYVDALPQLMYPQTGRVHTSFKQDVAATGRLSSQDPNLQNIPIRTREGREIRSAFVPGEDGWRLVTADYSQIELRVLAHFSADSALQAAFADDQDIHARVASEVYGVPLDQVAGDMRRSAKAVNFGVIYGQSPFGLAKSLGIAKDDAAAFIDAYFQRYTGVEKFIEQVLDECRQKGYVETILGRRRIVQGVRSLARRSARRQLNLSERIAVNTVIQGSAADVIKQAMIEVHIRLRRDGLAARMLLQIHDELVFEAPGDEVDALVELVREEMTGAAKLDVPLKVDVKSGANWAECEPC